MKTNVSKKRWDAILERLPKGKLTGAEVGAASGKCSERLLARSDITLYLIDRWCVPPPGDSYHQGAKVMNKYPQKKFDEMMDQCLARVSKYHGRFHVMHSTTLQAASKIEDASLDFAFIDADHSYLGTIGDISAYLPKIKPGGLLCGHDYENDNTIGEVKRAVHEALGDKIELSYDHTWFYRVPA